MSILRLKDYGLFKIKRFSFNVYKLVEPLSGFDFSLFYFAYFIDKVIIENSGRQLLYTPAVESENRVLLIQTTEARGEKVAFFVLYYY